MGIAISLSSLFRRKNAGTCVRGEQHDAHVDPALRTGRLSRPRAWNIGFRIGRRADGKPDSLAAQVLDGGSRDAVERLLPDRSLALVRLAIGSSRRLMAAQFVQLSADIR